MGYQDSLPTMKRVVKDEESSVFATKEVIAYRGTIIAFSSIALLKSSFYLMKTMPRLSYHMSNHGPAKGILTVFGIGASLMLIPTSIAILSHEISSMNTNIRMLKEEKRILQRDKQILENLVNQETEKTYQKTPTN